MRTMRFSLVVALLLIAMPVPALGSQADDAENGAPDSTIELTPPQGDGYSLTFEGSVAYLLFDQIIDFERLGLGPAPSWDTAQIQIERIAARTSIVPPEEGWPFYRGLVGFTQLQGKLEITVPEVVAVSRFRNPGILEIYAARRTIVMEPGDTAIHPDSTHWIVVNPGNEVAVYVFYALHVQPDFTNYSGPGPPAGWFPLATATAPIDPRLASGSVRLSAVAVMLPENASVTVGVGAAPSAQVLVVEGSAQVIPPAGGSLAVGSEFRLFNSGLDLELLSPGPVTLTNHRATAATVYLLRVEPVS